MPTYSAVVFKKPGERSAMRKRKEIELSARQDTTPAAVAALAAHNDKRQRNAEHKVGCALSAHCALRSDFSISIILRLAHAQTTFKLHH
jgi:hypothetical protein